MFDLKETCVNIQEYIYSTGHYLGPMDLFCFSQFYCTVHINIQETSLESICSANLTDPLRWTSTHHLFVQACVCLCVFLEVKCFVSSLMAPWFGPAEEGEKGL